MNSPQAYSFQTTTLTHPVSFLSSSWPSKQRLPLLYTSSLPNSSLYASSTCNTTRQASPVALPRPSPTSSVIILEDDGDHEELQVTPEREAKRRRLASPDFLCDQPVSSHHPQQTINVLQLHINLAFVQTEKSVDKETDSTQPVFSTYINESSFPIPKSHGNTISTSSSSSSSSSPICVAPSIRLTQSRPLAPKGFSVSRQHYIKVTRSTYENEDGSLTIEDEDEVIAQLDPYDESNELARGWVRALPVRLTTHPPPTLTKSGSYTTKRNDGMPSLSQTPVKDEKRMKENVINLGEGGLLDAVTYLSSREELGVNIHSASLWRRTLRHNQPLETTNDKVSSESSPPPPPPSSQDSTFSELSTLRSYHIQLNVSLKPSFYTSPYSGAKRILIEHLFSPKASATASLSHTLSSISSSFCDSSLSLMTPFQRQALVKEGITVDFFYQCLSRAEKTKGGLPINMTMSHNNRTATATAKAAAAATTNADTSVSLPTSSTAMDDNVHQLYQDMGDSSNTGKKVSVENKVTRNVNRRGKKGNYSKSKGKGKGKALEKEMEMDIDSEESNQKRLGKEAEEEEKEDKEVGEVEEEEDEEEEDEILHPPGLRANLMPFQSRTVRWLLRREGVYVKPTWSPFRERRLQEKLTTVSLEDKDVNNRNNDDKEATPLWMSDAMLLDENPHSVVLQALPSANVNTAEVKPLKKMNSADMGKGDFENEKFVNADGVPPNSTESPPAHTLEDVANLDESQLQVSAEDDDDGDILPQVELTDLPEDLMLEEIRNPLWEMVMIQAQASVTGPYASPTNARVAVKDSEGQSSSQILWLNRITGDLRSQDPASDGLRTPGGAGGYGLLSEEVGMGKTVEVLSLILLHRQPWRANLPTYYNPEIDSNVAPSGLTLIIAPAAIVAQWHSEIVKHTPCLKVLRYESIKSIKESWTPKFISTKYDVVLTTFDVLRRDVVLARKPHERDLRSGRESRHRYRRSLLVQLDFLRVIMDEAQMVGETVSAISETASLIPRKYSFAVTSTPLKSRIEDLQGLLKFLKVEPLGSSRANLSAFLDPSRVESFIRFWKILGERTLKSQVEKELIIPMQNRFVVPIDFGAVENYWYEQRYKEALNHLGLQQNGRPKQGSKDAPTAQWLPDKQELNRWLVILRQLCCHVQVGQTNKVIFGTVVKSVDEVLSALREKAVSAVLSDQRQLWSSRVKRAQYLMFDREDCERFETALQMFVEAATELQPCIVEVQNELREVWTLRRDAKRRSRHGSVSTTVSISDADGALTRALAEEDEEDENVPLSSEERNLAMRLASARKRLRDFLIVQHSAQFFIGSAYFNLGKFPDEETAAYAKADELRQTILTPWELRVERTGIRLREQMEDRDRADRLTPERLGFEFSQLGHGIVAAHVFEDIETSIDILNGWAELLWQWRDMILQMMYTRVSISGNDATGEEYADRAALQEKCDVYLEGYGVLLADWRQGLTGERSALADSLDMDTFNYATKKNIWSADAGSQRQRVTKKEQRKSLLKKGRVPSLEHGDSPADILRYELMVERTEAKGLGQADTPVVPIRHCIKALKDASENITRAEEIRLLDSEYQRLRSLLIVKEKVFDRLRSELVDITKAFNVRLEYFAQLQIVSDEVGDPDMTAKSWKGLGQEMLELYQQEDKIERSMQGKLSQKRYLEGLHANDIEAGRAEDVTHYCSICSEPFSKGVLTTCGHISCSACFRAWSAIHRMCSTCKRHLKPTDWEMVQYGVPKKVAEEKAKRSAKNESVLESSVRLNIIGEGELGEIEAMPAVPPLSSKSDTVVKHVMFLRRRDAAAKIVIFSAWIESLEILMAAFRRNGVQFVRLEGAGKKETVVTKFIQDPAIAAFFLHTKSQSAGLNLTCAQYVFLIEPLLHPSLELQAVGRVHRMGQNKETTVYQYYVSGTVDERIADLRGRQGSSLFLAADAGRVDNAKESRILNSDIAAGAPKKNGKKSSEEAIEDEDDISRCLLEPVHFLNLQKALFKARTGGGSIKTSASAVEDQFYGRSSLEQPQAGPSREQMYEAAVARANMQI